jgi:hypothetical protein
MTEDKLDKIKDDITEIKITLPKMEATLATGTTLYLKAQLDTFTGTPLYYSMLIAIRIA